MFIGKLLLLKAMLGLSFVLVTHAHSNSIIDVVAKVKSSVVGGGLYSATHRGCHYT
jgi:hypothetical protein